MGPSPGGLHLLCDGRQGRARGLGRPQIPRRGGEFSLRGGARRPSGASKDTHGRRNSAFVLGSASCIGLLTVNAKDIFACGTANPILPPAPACPNPILISSSPSILYFCLLYPMPNSPPK